MLDVWEALKWVGTAGFIVSLAPQALRTLRLRRADDFSVSFLVILLGASLALFLYMAHLEDYVLATSYGANLLVWGMVLYYRLRPAAAKHS